MSVDVVNHFAFVVVANRLPVDFEERPRGGTAWERSPGGLVTALEPVLRSHGGVWVGWPGVVDTALEPFAHDFGAAGVDHQALAEQLQRNGAESFDKSWHSLLDSIASKQEKLVGGASESQQEPPRRDTVQMKHDDHREV